MNYDTLISSCMYSSLHPANYHFSEFLKPDSLSISLSDTQQVNYLRYINPDIKSFLALGITS